MFRKRAPPAIGEIKDRHVEYEHGVVPVRASSKEIAQPAFETGFTVFRFHFGFCISLMLKGRWRPTTLQ